jgi:hypothetical protein
MRFLNLISLVILTAGTLAITQTLTTSEAANHIGEKETVCGQIVGEHTASNSQGSPTFINLDKPYPHQAFTLLIWSEDRQSVGDLPKTGRICASGTISQYRGSPEIVLRDAHSWYVPR